jgi:nicotinate-nucleotide pyrophosphorylase
VGVEDLTALVERALEEDLGTGDVTTAATVSPEAKALATITQKAPGVIYGFEAAEIVFRRRRWSASSRRGSGASMAAR